jgi:hypothetical protein
MKRTVAAAVVLLAAAGCTGQGRPRQDASRPKVSAPPAAVIPVLHAGTSAKIKWVTGTTGAGADVTVATTWRISSVSWIPYAAAVQGGGDGDVAASLGSEPLPAGDRYLVLGLTITNDGPGAMDDTSFPLSSGGDFTTVTHAGGKYVNGQTGPFCESQQLPGMTYISGKYASGICDTGTLEPGQSAAGYALFALPTTPTLLIASGTSGSQQSQPVAVIDPGNLVHKTSCPCCQRSADNLTLARIAPR